MAGKGHPPPRRRPTASSGGGSARDVAKALEEIQRAAGYKRKRVSQNPATTPTDEKLRRQSKVSTVRMPTAPELLRMTEPVLAEGRRTPGTPLPIQQPILPTAEELLGMTGGALRPEGQQENVDRTEYLSPPRSTDPDRPRARQASYNPDNGTLKVVFRNGGTYTYFQVPHQTWGALKKAPSFGQTFDRLILNRYEFEKVSY